MPILPIEQLLHRRGRGGNVVSTLVLFAAVVVLLFEAAS